MILQKPYSKRYAFVTLRSSNLKIVLILLAEVIALYMQMTIVEIGVPGFEKPIKFVSSFTSWGLVLDPLDTSFYELLEGVIVCWGPRSGSRCMYRAKSGDFRAWHGRLNGRSSITYRRYNRKTRTKRRVESRE